jgi:hypothetical protein
MAADAPNLSGLVSAVLAEVELTDGHVADFVSAARAAVAGVPPGEAINVVSKAYFDLIDPMRPGKQQPSEKGVKMLRQLYDDVLGGKLSPPDSPPDSPPAVRAGASSDQQGPELLYPVMDGRGDPFTWQRADSVTKGLGRKWREVLGLGPSFESLGGCDALFVSPHAATRTDPLGFPVRLASGYYADPGDSVATEQSAIGVIQSCRAVLARAVAHDNRCLQAGASGSTVCANREVKRLGTRICNHYDGAGNLYLAECDCLKGRNRPAETRVADACYASLARNETRQKRSSWEKDLTLEDCRRLDVTAAGTGPWGLPANPSRVSDPIAQNMIARFMNRSYRELDRFAGYPVACFYPPCSDRYASYGYTDAQDVYTDLAACPSVRCSAEINVNWVSKDVTITGNTLEVRCDGGACLTAGLPKCKNNGRCIPDPATRSIICDCRGTGFKGPTCEEPLGEDETEASQLPPEVTNAAKLSAQVAASHARENIRVGFVFGFWFLVFLAATVVIARLFFRRRYDHEDDIAQSIENGKRV